MYKIRLERDQIKPLASGEKDYVIIPWTRVYKAGDQVFFVGLDSIGLPIPCELDGKLYEIIYVSETERGLKDSFVLLRLKRIE